MTIALAPSRARKPIALRLAAAAVTAAVATVAFASGSTAAVVVPPSFSNIPSTLPGNVPSVGFEATSTSEFGDLIGLGGSVRASASLPVTVVMSVWACESGGYSTCVTTPGATWTQAITLHLYDVDTSGSVPAVGSPILSKTQSFALPYRPSYDPSGPCAAIGSTGWYSAADGHCYNGFAHEITFTLPSGVTLPDELIWTVSFDTSNHGFDPIGTPGPWDSLNVGAETFSGQPAYGADVEPDSAFVNSTWGGMYADGGAGGTGFLRDDVGGWTGYAPLACFGVVCSVPAPTPTPTPTATAAATATPTATATATGTEAVGGETAQPTASGSQSVEGATGTPAAFTPPPTSTNGSGSGGSGTLAGALICATFGALGLVATSRQRASVRRRRG